MVRKEVFEKLSMEGALTRECHELALKNTNPNYQQQIPPIETLIQESGVDELSKELHANDRFILWNTNPLLAYLVDFSYLHESHVHQGRERKSRHPYTHHLNEAGSNFIANTTFPQSEQDLQFYTTARIGINRHDSTEERSDDEVERREKQGTTVNKQEKLRIRRENLRAQHNAYNTAIDVLADKLQLNTHEKQTLYELEINNLLIEDKLSRGRLRTRREVDTYDQYTENALAGPTQIFGYKSNVVHELISEISKCYETGQNGDTTFPNGQWVLKNNQRLSAHERKIITEVTRNMQLGGITWTQKGPVYEPNHVSRNREKLEQLYDAATTEALQNKATGNNQQQAKEAFKKKRAYFKQKEQEYKEVLEDYLYIIPPASRADTIQWNAYISNITARSVRSASTNPERKQQVTPWLLETTKDASTYLAERTILHAQMQIDNEIVYNQFPITKAREIRKRAADFQEHEQSFRVTSAQETKQLPRHLQPYDEFTNWLMKLAEKDPEAINEFTNNPEIHVRQMAVATEMCYRLLHNAARRPEKIINVTGNLN